jgi:hypothetical protein
VSVSFGPRFLLLWLMATSAASVSDPPERTFDLAITRGVLPAQHRVLRVEKADPVRLRFTSDVAGEVHFHAYRLQVRVTPGAAGELKFVARATGRFRIEWHAAGAAATGADHHAPPLATLEVRPK